MGLAGELKSLIGGIFIAIIALLKHQCISLQIHQPKQSNYIPDMERNTASTSEFRSRPADHSVSQSILENYGLSFNDRNELIDGDNQPFMFDLYSSHEENQERYEMVGVGVEYYLYEVLETMLERKPVREDGKGTTIFASENHEDAECLLVLIHGSGAVRAGMWSRRIMINNNLDAGSQIPYIKRALNNGWGVIVTNTNDHHDVEGSRSPSNHGLYVWNRFIKGSRNKKIAIVAHSAGGGVTTDLLQKYQSDFEKRVFAIAYTDSFGYPSFSSRRYFLSVTTNWVASWQPLGDPIMSRSEDIYCVSAGTHKHEWTSHSAIDRVFEYIESSFRELKPGNAVNWLKQKWDKERAVMEQRERKQEMSKTKKKKDEESDMSEPKADWGQDGGRDGADSHVPEQPDHCKVCQETEREENMATADGLEPTEKQAKVENEVKSVEEAGESEETPMDVTDCGPPMASVSSTSEDEAAKDRSLGIKEVRALKAQNAKEDADKAAAQAKSLSAQQDMTDLSLTVNHGSRSRAQSAEDNDSGAPAARKNVKLTTRVPHSNDEHNNPASPQQQANDIPGVHRTPTETEL